MFNNENAKFSERKLPKAIWANFFFRRKKFSRSDPTITWESKNGSYFFQKSPKSQLCEWNKKNEEKLTFFLRLNDEFDPQIENPIFLTYSTGQNFDFFWIWEKSLFSGFEKWKIDFFFNYSTRRIAPMWTNRYVFDV